jgi:MoxR-like ATPases
MVCATQNPIEYEGTYPLPEAQLDRFLVKLNVPVPGRDDEIAVLQRHAGGFDPRDLSAIDRVAGVEDLSAGREAVRKVHIDPKISGYVVDLCRATRQSPSLQLGVSPRGATALLATSRAWAWLSGRDYVTPDDVKALAGRRCGTASSCARRPISKVRPPTASSKASSPPSPLPDSGPSHEHHSHAHQHLRGRRTIGSPRSLRGPGMALTGRTGLLAALGAIVLLFVPHWWALLALEGALAVGVAADLALAGNVRRLRLHRSGDTNVRLGETANVSLIVENLGRRRVKARLRDAWPPSAGATPVAAATSRSGRPRSNVTLTIPAASDAGWT